MILTVVLSILCIYAVHLFIKYVVRPYLRMREFKGIKGVQILKFMPLIGAFYLAEQSYKKHGDQNYFAKIAYQTFPGMRALITNGLNKVFIILTDPQLLKKYYLNEKNYVKDRFFIENRMRIFGNGVVFAEGKQWAKRRKIMSSVFHFSFFQSFVPKILSIVQNQFKQLDKNSNQNKPIEINSMEFSSMIAGRTVVKSFFGLKFEDSLENLQLSVFLQRLIAKVGSQQRTLRSFMFGVKLLKMGLFKQDRQINRQIQVFREMVRESITNKLEDKQQQQGSLLKILKEKNLIQTEEGLTKDQLIEEFLTLFIAGTDTTSHLMGMMFYYLAINPDIQQRLREQLMTLEKDNLNYKSINSLPYLSDVIKQTFRHYDYMVSTFPRVATQDHNLGDLSIKKGDLIMPGWAELNYQPQVFPNPHQFNPDRWKQADKNPSIDMIFSPFSNGSRSCLGKNFALLQAKIVTYLMLIKYNLKLKEGYVHLLKAAALYEPVNPIILQLYLLENRKIQ